MKNSILHYSTTMNFTLWKLMTLKYTINDTSDTSVRYLFIPNYHFTCRVKTHQPSCENILRYKCTDIRLSTKKFAIEFVSIKFIDKNRLSLNNFSKNPRVVVNIVRVNSN